MMNNTTIERYLFGDEEGELQQSMVHTPNQTPTNSSTSWSIDRTPGSGVCNLSHLPEEVSDLLGTPDYKFEMSLLTLNDTIGVNQTKDDILLPSNCDAKMIEQSFSPIVSNKTHRRSKKKLTRSSEKQNPRIIANVTTTTPPEPPPLPMSRPSVSVLMKLLDEKEKRFWSNFARKESNLFHQLNNFTVNLY